MTGTERPVQGRTPADLCKQALTLANDSQSQIGCLRAITMAICGLAGEVHELGKRKSNIHIKTIEVDTLVSGGTISFEDLDPFGDIDTNDIEG